MSRNSSKDEQVREGGQLELPLFTAEKAPSAMIYTFPRPQSIHPKRQDDALRRILDFAAKLPGR